ncbi:MAG: hypothetical protein Q7U76_09500 [Nitrospirota bacterium]|nr:hypothetical protein [Nitrospirota bacterium]
MPIFCQEPLKPMKYAVGSKVNRQPIEMSASLSLSVWLAVALLVVPCGAQAPPQTPTPPAVQNQAGQAPQIAPPSAAPSGGVSTAGPTALPASGVGSSASSSLGKRFGSAGQGLPGMPGGPSMKGSMGSQDPSGKYMTPPTIQPLLCDPAVNIPC